MHRSSPDHRSFPTSRRSLMARLLGTAALLATGAQVPAQAADYPDRTVKFIVNFPPGGPLDIIARLVAARLTTTLGQPFVVENVTGASGNIGAAQVARANPDGYTVLVSIDTPFTMTPSLYPATSVKPDDLRAVASMGLTGSTVAVNPSLGVQSLKELIDKGQRETITFATAGNGTPGHFAALMLADATGIKINPIHYRGNAPAVLALVSGEVQAGILSTSGLAPHIKAGKVKALAVAGSNHSSLLPDIPTSAEQGVPGLDLEFMFVAMVPARTPDTVVATLHKAIADAVAQPDFQSRLRAMDVASTRLGSAAVADWLAKDRARYEAVVKKTGMKAE